MIVFTSLYAMPHHVVGFESDTRESYVFSSIEDFPILVMNTETKQKDEEGGKNSILPNRMATLRMLEH